MSEAYAKFKELSKDDAHWVTVRADHKGIDAIHSEILERFVNYYYEGMERVSLDEISNSLFKNMSSQLK